MEEALGVVTAAGDRAGVRAAARAALGILQA